MNTSASTKQYRKWNYKDTPVEDLSKAFNTYIISEGKKGIEPLPQVSKGTTAEVVRKIPSLEQYNPKYLAKNISNISKKVLFEH